MTYAAHMKASAQDYLRTLLHRHSNNVMHAAVECGVSRSNFYTLLKRAGVDPPLRPRRKAVWQDLHA